jgi:hypothetical protein
MRLGADPDLDLRELAVDALYRGDGAGTYRPFYLDQCRDANRAAFRAIARHADASTPAAMRELLSGDAGPIRGERRMMAVDVLRKCDILLSPDGSAKLAELRDEWALAAAKARELPGLQELIRGRLDRIMDFARQKHKFWSDENLKEEIQPAPFEERYILHRGSDVMPDFLYDDLLLAYRDGGGVLSDLERRRLREFGYEGDPETLLRAFVPAGE